MTSLADHLSKFLREHLPRERKASPHTCEAYAYAFQLLVCFAASRLKVRPSQLTVEQLDVPLVLAFLEYVEAERRCTARTRNARLAAIHSFFHFLEYRVPSCLEQARQVGAIPIKKTDQALVRHLNREEIRALLDAPDAQSAAGLRDRAMLHLAFAAGLKSRNWLASDWTSSSADQRLAFTSWERDDASASCPCGKKRAPQSKLGSKHAPQRGWASYS